MLFKKKKKLQLLFAMFPAPHLKGMSAEHDWHIFRTLVCGTTEYRLDSNLKHLTATN